MRLKEFIKEGGRNSSSSEFDTTANTKPAPTPDWLKKVGNYLGDKMSFNKPVSLAPGALPPVEQPKSTYAGIDPQQRQRLGLPPATHDEIDAYFKKPENSPFIKGLTDRDGRPVMSGSALELERAAREAAPREFYPPLEKAAAPVAPPAPAAGMSDAEIAANAQRIKTPREQGNYLNQEFDDRSFDRSPVAPGGSEAPRTKVAAPASATVQGGADNRLSKFPDAAVAQPVPNAAAVAQPVPNAAAIRPFDRGNQTVAGAQSAELNPDAPAKKPDTQDLERLKDLAGVKDLTAPAKEPPVAVKDRLAAVDSGSPGRAANAGVAAGAPASTNDPEEFIRDKSDDKFDPIKKTKLADPVPGVAGIQEFLNSLGMTDAQGNRLKPDGVWGHRSQEAKDKFYKKFKYDTPEDKKYNELVQKVPKSYWTTVVPDAKGQPMGNAGPGASGSSGSSAGPGANNAPAANNAPSATDNVSLNDTPKQQGWTEKLPGVKDSKGRQIWKRSDGLLAGFDLENQTLYHITEKNPLMRNPNAGAETGDNSKLQPIGKDNKGRTIYRYANGRFGAWDADNRKMITIDAPASQATVVKESSDTQRMRLLAGLTGK